VKFLNENAPIPITCPECGEEFTKTIRQLKAESHFVCPGDSCSVGFDADKLLSDLEDVDDDLDDSGDSIGDIAFS